VSQSFDIESNTSPIEICVVTVDSLNRNVVVWEKPLLNNIQGFYVYRNISGAYSLIGFQPYDSISQYVDNSFGVDPNVTSYRYKVAVLDSCGNESDLSNYHETIHVTTNQGINGEVNLIWDDYEGFAFTDYNILRDSTGSGDWEIIANVPNTNFTYTDANPPSTGQLDYVVEVVLSTSCSAEKAQDHNSTRSNRSTAIAHDPDNGTTIDELILSQMNVFPNPSTGKFIVDVRSVNWTYEIYDLSGKLILTKEENSFEETINISSVEHGIYLLKVSIDNDFIYKKIVKQ